MFALYVLFSMRFHGSLRSFPDQTRKVEEPTALTMLRRPTLVEEQHISRCACTDVYDPETGRCYMTDPGPILWYGGYGGSHHRHTFVRDLLARSGVRMKHIHVNDGQYANGGCDRTVVQGFASYDRYLYHWLDSDIAYKLYLTCKHVLHSTTVCLRRKTSLNTTQTMSDQSKLQERSYVCSVFDSILLRSPSRKAVSSYSLSSSDVLTGLWSTIGKPPALSKILQHVSLYHVGKIIPIGQIIQTCGLMGKGQKCTHAKRKIAAITICKDEINTIVFTIGALIEHVDHYIVADTGSKDTTINLLRQTFSDYLVSKKLFILTLNCSIHTSIARNAALQVARSLSCAHIMKIDADDVFYDANAREMMEAVRCTNKPFQKLWVPQYELVQGDIESSLDWLHLVRQEASQALTRQMKSRVFRFRLDQPYGHDRVIVLSDDLQAKGSWTDEAHGLPAEGFRSRSTGALVFFVTSPALAHYGWARPLEFLYKKLEAWEDQKVDKANMKKRVVGMLTQPFQTHPESVLRHVNSTIKTVELHLMKFERNL
ncbi:hypothetical protein GUITHDRAFT_115963 [Guillardia theta CCMP2712]|uniref:Glycosyltransferase 2-like domain-containing protein n=2 Tax=Guillardia theta TaxID=55529 RepID=L1IPN1_GUITC|nr:hypothetical protein GUITHDRAFT_115963 [Guillardia theta CCMP2712]EKX37824.1 hypothetical protein GUITHDRAFT_115963 [Guillardia theta CCMP2712]|eukprot:XP_005824804.1 hypothetical protein GUITHDRAFT_115963 [Guillardia theta CCMP2712]